MTYSRTKQQLWIKRGETLGHGLLALYQLLAQAARQLLTTKSSGKVPTTVAKSDRSATLTAKKSTLATG